MKTCPQCGKTYPDEYAFCLSDGAPLNTPRAAQPVWADEQPTVVRQPVVRKRRATGAILLFVLAGLLMLALGAAAGVAYVFWPRQASNEEAKTNTPSATPSSNRNMPDPRPSPETNSRPQRSATPTPSPANNRATPPEESPPPPDADAPDPGRTRISFQRGRADETVSGRINNIRSFVLYAKNGQSLTARIRSDKQCVTFDGGSPRISYPTDEGDNVISIVNNCDSPAHFSMSVNIR
ncbi:MAG TPA: hypothetical protein VMZ26_15450 [Pyrinomonadaceae bacterium]|nr:hypothetical protein [Pyrinomonadaceae bacterium]